MGPFTRSTLVLALVGAAALPALAQQKVGIIQMQGAMLGTKEGQKAVADLESRMGPKRKELETKQNELQALQTQGQAAKTEADKARLARDLDTKNKAFQRMLEDARGEFQVEQDKMMNDLGGKVMAVVGKYAKDNGFSLVMDVSNPQTPIMYASETMDITKAVVEAYDKNGPAAAAQAKPAVMAPQTKK